MEEGNSTRIRNEIDGIIIDLCKIVKRSATGGKNNSLDADEYADMACAINELVDARTTLSSLDGVEKVKELLIKQFNQEVADYEP